MTRARAGAGGRGMAFLGAEMPQDATEGVKAMSSARNATSAPVALAMTEKQLQGAVTNLAKLLGWKVYHSWISIRSTAGFPDLVCVRDGTLLFIELKGPRGVVSEAQRGWLDDLGAVQNRRTAVFIWTPEHWHNGIIEYVLQHRTQE